MSPAVQDVVQQRVAEVLAGFDRGWCFTPLKGKRPLMRGWQKAPHPSRQECESWARQGNVGLRTGKPSGVIVVDLDEGCDTTDMDLPTTVTVRTGSGGRHLYYRAPKRTIRNSAGKLGKHIDLRGDGGQAVFPGSVHPKTGVPYQWEEGLGPDEVEMAPLPRWIIEKCSLKKKPSVAAATHLKPYGAKALEDELTRLRAAPNGSRNDQLNRSAFALGQLVGGGVLDRAEVESELLAATDLPEKEARATIASGLEAGIQEPRTPPQTTDASSNKEIPHLTDVGNGIRLVRRHGNNLRYCPPWKQWLMWDGTRWVVDEMGRIKELAKETVRAIYREAADLEDPELRQKVSNWAHQSEAMYRLEQMIKCAQTEAGIPIEPGAFDRDPWLFNVANGTLDLRTGELRPHSPDDMITKMSPVRFNPKAQCPTWKEFLDRILGGDEQLISYMQRVVGYWLTGSTREQCFFVHYGTGSNGKSVFLNVVRELLGDYAEQTPASSFMVKRAAESATNDLARLRGARFVTAVETADGQRFSEPIMKQLTGEDPITARFLFKEFFSYQPVFKVALATNHKPTIRGTDHGIWRRVRLIPFTVTIPDEEQDRELTAKLKTELPGILNWTLEGCLNWLEDGSLRDPQVVLSATQEYRQEQDRFAQFVDECCLTTAEMKTGATTLYREYHRWAEERGERPFSQKRLGEWLKQQGYERKRGATGRYLYCGIGLREEGQP